MTDGSGSGSGQCKIGSKTLGRGDQNWKGFRNKHIFSGPPCILIMINLLCGRKTVGSDVGPPMTERSQQPQNLDMTRSTPVTSHSYPFIYAFKKIFELNTDILFFGKLILSQIPVFSSLYKSPFPSFTDLLSHWPNSLLNDSLTKWFTDLMTEWPTNATFRMSRHHDQKPVSTIISDSSSAILYKPSQILLINWYFKSHFTLIHPFDRPIVNISSAIYI